MNSVIICGSMSFYNEMLFIKQYLLSFNINAHVPDSDELSLKKNMSSKSNEFICAYKGMMSRIHFNKILKKSTMALLIVNPKKNSIENYIGANTLVEIGLAFIRNKSIFILYDFPIIYKEELCAWGAVPLRGDINLLINHMKKEVENQFWLPGVKCYGQE